MTFQHGTELAKIVGADITAIWWSEDRLTFDTTVGPISYEVEGDCCSHSYFFDFYGVRNLLDNGPVTAFEEVGLSKGDPGWHDPEVEVDWQYIQCYGYRFTTEHPTLGPVSSVLSFRNASNGYYGGWMHVCDGGHYDQQSQITQDVVG